MLSIDSSEVIVAQTAGSYAANTKVSVGLTIQIVSNPIYIHSDIYGDHFSVPVHVGNEENLRVGDIIVILDGTQVVGVFLR